MFVAATQLSLVTKTLMFFVFIGLVFVCFNTPVLRLIKTAYLIATITPYEREVPSAPRILVLGDSTGYGTGADKNSDSIAGLIGRDYPDYTILNNSKNGRTIGELLIITEQLEGTYDLILLQIGGNDILQSRDVGVVEAELRTIVSQLSLHTNSIVMISAGNIGGASAFKGDKAQQLEKQTREFRAMFMRVGNETSLHYVDLFLEPEVDVMSNNPKVYLAIDGLHPSSAGYALWYQSLAPVLQQHLMSL